MTFFHQLFFIAYSPVIMPRIIKVIIFFIITHKQHTVLIGTPLKNPAGIRYDPFRSRIGFFQINTCPEYDRHVIIYIMPQ